MTKQIRYFIGSTDENLVISECDGMYQMSAITYQRWENEDTICLPYHCYLSGEQGRWTGINHHLKSGIWTKKIPLFVKNVHREVWGLPPLKEEKIVPVWFLDYQDGTVHCPTEEYVGSIPDAARDWLLSRQLGSSGSKRCHWFGNKEMFKTWVFPCHTNALIEQLVPLLEGTPYVAALKCW